ncbi:MAG: InlB B-repeat-containing protein [Paludibacteraceae bacterium]|nr:InlB B-repeat-containing protein [Paludibacteraceae bacterium]
MKHFYFFTNRVRKSFRGLALVASLVLFAGNVWGASTTIAGNTSGTVTDVLSWTTEKNSAGSPPVWSDTHFRIYYAASGAGGSMTITPVAGITITGFTLTATSTSYTPAVKYNIDGGADVSGTWSSTTMAVTGLSATSSLKFRNANTSNTQLRVAVEVTYEVAAPATPYTVYFNAGTGSCGTASLTEASAGEGVTLPPASPSGGCAAESPAWVFAGWATASQTETTTAPTLLTSGDTYYPSADVTLYAVYSKTTGGSTDATLTNAEIKDGTANGSYANITVSSASGTWGGKAIRNIATGFIQINKNSSNYYFGSPTFAGGITSVTINTNNGTASGRRFYLRSSNATAEPTSGDLGEGTIPAANGSATITVTGAPTSFYIYSNGAAYIASVTVTYGSGTTTYNSNPNCCTAPTTALALTSSEGTSLILSGGDAETTIGVASGTGNSGAVTYAITSGDENHALLDESTGDFTADATGTWTITATQALNGATCGGTATITITVSEASSTITYNANGGTGTMTAQTGTTGADVTLTSNSFTRTGYTFTGWNTASDGTGTVYANGATTVYQPMTLYAQWSIISRTVTSNLTGCTATGIPANVNFETTAITATVTADACYTLPTDITVTMGGTALTADYDYMWDASTGELLLRPGSDPVAFTGNIVITITATATPNRTVTFSTGLAGLDIAAASVACGSSTTLPTVDRNLLVCEQGKDFAGWSTNSEATSVEYAEGANYTPTGDVTLYGVWSEGTVSNNYKKITTADEVTDGDYIVCYNFNSTTIAMTNTVYATGQLTATEVTPSSDIITTTDNSIIWKIQKSGGNYTIKNEAVNKYANISGSNLVLETTSSNYTLRVSSGKFYFTSSLYELLGYINASGNYFFAKSGTSTYNAYLYKRQASVTYSTTATCTLACADAAVVTLTPTPSSINMPASGNATTTIAFSQLGGGAGTWGTPSVTRLSGTGTASVTINGTNIDFSTTGVGEYEVSIAYTQNCAKVGKTTITVLATPVVTIVDVTPLTFTANCGEASAAKSVSVSGYNLTANMTATAPTNFLVSSDNSTYGPSATFTQSGGTASGTLYIKANPPAGSTNPISGNVSLTSTDATTRTLAVSATVSCTPVTVTFLDWDGTFTVWNTYYSGSIQTLPAPTRDACTGWTFSGWTTNNLTAISAGDIVGTTGANLTLTGSTTYYAVYTQGGGSSTIFSDDFADLNTANTQGVVSRDNWQALTKVYVDASPNNSQFRLGTSSVKGIATTVLMSELTGAGTLTFDLQLYGTDANKDVVVTINNGTITTASSAKSSTSNTATYTTSSTKTTHTIALNGGGTATSITFAAVTTSNNRFYLDNVSVVIGSGTYTLSPACCDINLVKPTVTTSSADESVTVSWPSVKDGGVEKATAYELTYKLASSPDDPTVVPVAATGAASYSQTITGLTNCLNYVFTVEAIGDPNAATTICSSPIASVTTYPGVAHTVNYQYGAGTGTPNVWVSGCTNGTSTTLPAVTPNTLAYVFAGWYDGTTRVGGAGDSYTPTADVTLVAQYSAAPTYTLTFVNEGAPILTKTVYSTAAENDRKATEPNANYADYGLESNPLTTACSEAVFVGWTTTETVAQGTTTSPTLVTFPYTISANATLYALWKITEGGGSEVGTYTFTGTGQTTATVSPALPSGVTYTFNNTYNSGSQITADKTMTLTVTGLNTTVNSVSLNLRRSNDGSYNTVKLVVGGVETSDNTLTPTTTAADYTYFDGNRGAVNTGSGDITLSIKASASSAYCYNMVLNIPTGTTTFYSVPKCDPEVSVSEVCAMGTPAIAMSAPVGGSDSQSYTAYATNIDDSGTKLYWTLTGTGKSSFSLNWQQTYLEGGVADSVFVLTYTPVSTLTATATLQFFADNTAGTASCEIPLTGTTCTAPVLSATSTTNTITITSTTDFGATDTVYVWNNETSEPEGGCGVFPFDSIYCKNGTAKGGKYRDLPQGVKTFTIGSTRLYQGSTYSYRGATGNCDAAVKTITTKIPTDAPVLTVSPTLWETVAEANRDSTSTTITLTGSNMNSAQVSYTLTGASAFTVVSPTSPITLSASGGATVTVKYKPTKAETSITYLDFSYTSACETKTVRVTLVGNVPGIDIVEVNPDASGFTLHTDLEGTPNIVLSQEVEHQGDGRQANDLFFSKYFEAAQTVKLLGLYNGTNDTISLRGIRIGGHKAGNLPEPKKAALWNPTEIIALDTLQYIAPGKEIILFSATGADATTVSCIAGSVGWEHEGWYPVSDKTAETVFNDATRNLFINGKNGNTNASIQTGGDRVYGLQRKAVDGTWEFIDVIGALHSTAQGDSVIGRQVKASGALTGMDDPGWVCMDGTNYLTKEAAPLSTNRHLLIRKNTVVDGLNALEQNTEDFATLCTEWEGLFVPKNGVGELTEQEITCLHFGQVSTFNYDGYYASFERIDDNLVTFTAASGRPGDWVGSFLNPTVTFQDSLRCYNLKISVERYYNMLVNPPVELSKAQVKNLDPVDDAAILAALDTVEVMSTQYKVPIIVKTNDSITTKDGRFIELSKDTCSTCDVVILNKGILTKSSDADDRDSVRTVYVYKGGRLVVPGNLNYAIQNLHIRAEGDSVGSAYIQGNLKMQQARIYHDKRIDNTKYYFFALPYSCAVSKITEMNGKTLGVYGTSWAIKYYDGLSRIENHGLESNWKLVAADATLEAGRGYVLAISSDIKKFVRFPLVTEATFTENTTAKTLDVTMYGNEEAVAGTLGYNNVGWNLVGNPYIAHFTSAASGNDGVNNGTVELGGYYQTGNSAWNRLDTEHIYVTVPNANNVGYTQARASETKLSPFISFFVQAQATGSLTFATTSRKQAPIVAAGVKSTTVDQTNTIALNLTVGAETDRTTFILNDDYITGYEIGSDLLKWKGTWAKLPYFYSFDEDNNPLAYNAVPYSEAKKQMPLGFYMPTKYAPYKFSIDRSRSDLTDLEHVYLLRKGSVVADLLLNDYSNTDIARMAENKEFAISIQRSATVITPVAETVTEGLVPYAWIKGHEMRIEQVPAEGQLVILDAVGRAIEVRTLTGNHVETFTLRSDGVYAVSITTPQNQYILKVVTQ